MAVVVAHPLLGLMMKIRPLPAVRRRWERFLPLPHLQKQVVVLSRTFVPCRQHCDDSRGPIRLASRTLDTVASDSCLSSALSPYAEVFVQLPVPELLQNFSKTMQPLTALPGRVVLAVILLRRLV